MFEDNKGVVARVFSMLKPGGGFYIGTACVGDTMEFLKIIAPIAKAARTHAAPLKVFATE